ncbi:hypothetical protein VTJ83DRAFT_2198 [Remersonia thermophila]|uniref:Uncharacterized protein n=1 Tax=Remersonia thermophila TaxID=72144 RepID=A0ABR4DKD4_9PEZI
MAGIAAALAFSGIPDIAKIVKDFDFSKIDVRESSREDYLTVKLAPSYGKLNSESIKAMDEHLKIMIAAALKAIAAIPPQERSWERVIGAMTQSPLLEPKDDGISRADKLIKSGTNVFKIDGSPDQGIVREVKSWFTSLINDEDVLNSTQIDIGVLADIVAQTGATVDHAETILYKHERHEKTLVDIGVLRFPDPENPFFKVYRIQLEAWSSSARILFVQEDQNGISGQYNVRRFQPRSSVIEGISKDIRKKAVKEAEDLFR